MSFTIVKRLVIGNAVILLLVSLLGGMIYLNLNQLRNVTRNIVVKNQESIIVGDRFLDSMNQLVNHGEKFFVSKDTDYYTRFYAVHGVDTRLYSSKSAVW